MKHVINTTKMKHCPELNTISYVFDPLGWSASPLSSINYNKVILNIGNIMKDFIILSLAGSLKSSINCKIICTSTCSSPW